MPKNIRDKDSRLKTVDETPPPSYDERMKAQLAESLGSRAYERRDPTTQAAGDVPFYGDFSLAQTDRYGTNGGAKEQNNAFPTKAELQQKPEAVQKGASATGYRRKIDQIVE